VVLAVPVSYLRHQRRCRRPGRPGLAAGLSAGPRRRPWPPRAWSVTAPAGRATSSCRTSRQIPDHRPCRWGKRRQTTRRYRWRAGAQRDLQRRGGKSPCGGGGQSRPDRPPPPDATCPLTRPGRLQL